jgi:hypothetical protein
MPPRWVVVAFLTWLVLSLVLTLLVTLHRHQALTP